MRGKNGNWLWLRFNCNGDNDGEGVKEKKKWKLLQYTFVCKHFDIYAYATWIVKTKNSNNQLKHICTKMFQEKDERLVW